MTQTHYCRTITVANTPKAAFQALTKGFEFWWTKPDGVFTQLGDRAKFTFPPGKSFWTFEATLLEANERVEMRCVEALHLHEGMPSAIEQEWLGTTVTWQIVAKENQTDICLEHQGLVPSLHCFEVCLAGWDFFFGHSLKTYLDSGAGQPHTYSA